MTSHVHALWQLLGGDPARLDSLRVRESEVPLLPSRFDVAGFAVDAVAVASLAIAELAPRPAPTVTVDATGACAAFRCEALFEPAGWALPPTWDPVAGDYRARDRWIRLHTNYGGHRRAALEVLGVDADRSAVATAVAAWDAAELETAVVGAGGCAAVMYDREEWRAHPHGAVTLDEPPITIARRGSRSRSRSLTGLKVLDLTRVLAGPACTRLLAAYGAQVLRIDPPGFEEVGAIVPEMSAGKRCASLSFHDPRFAELVASADVLVHGLRPGSLAAHGLDEAQLRAWNPSLVIATLSAYGEAGPWSKRRGFDSLVQMSSGIAHGGDAHERPKPLPAQALDHGAGYLLAAGVCRALADGEASTVRASLLGVANHLWRRGEPMVTSEPPPPWPRDIFEDRMTAWGPARAVRVPGVIAGVTPSWSVDAGPLGRDVPRWI